MEGQPVARAVPAAGPWVYTLYRKAEGPFVHALNTEGFALCIDLPAAARSGRRRGARVGPRAWPRRVDALRRQPARSASSSRSRAGRAPSRHLARTPGGCSSSRSDRAATTSSATTTSCATSSCPRHVDKAEPASRGGPARRRATPAAVPWVYTAVPQGHRVRFVHALNTEGFALCIDLPAAAAPVPLRRASGGSCSAPATGLSTPPTPRSASSSRSPPATPGVRRTARIPRGAIGAAPRLAVAPDGATLYVPTAGGVVAVDTSTLKCAGRCCAATG